MGLFLPRNRSATCVARRPSTAPSASITRHGRSFEFTFGKYVFIFPKKRNDFIRRARKVNRYLCLKHVRTAAARLKKRVASPETGSADWSGMISAPFIFTFRGRQAEDWIVPLRRPGPA